MAVKRRKTIRTTQPSGPVPLDPYWLKRGLVLYDVGNGWIWTKKGGWQGTSSRVGPPRLQTTAKYGAVKGYGTTYGVGTTDRTDGPAIDLSTGFRSMLTFSYANSAGGGTFGRILQKAGTAGNASGDESWYVSTPSSAEILYQRVDTSNFGSWIIPGSVVTGQWVGYGMTHDQRTVATVPVMYKNGAVASVSTLSASAASYPTGTITLDIGNRSTTGDRCWDGMLGPKLIFDHPVSGLSAAEHKTLFENPHQVALLAARRSPAATAGTISPPLLTNTSTLYAPVVGSGGLSVPLLTNTSTLYAPVVGGLVELWDDHERSNINIAASSIDQDSYAPTIRIYPRLHLSDSWATPAYEFFHARVTGVLGKRPNFKVRYYTTASTGVLDAWGFQSTQRCMWSYDQVTWNFFDTHALSADNLNVDFKENADFTSDTVYVASQRPFTGTMVAAMVADLAATYPAYVSMPTSSAGNAYVADTIGTQTDERGRVIAAQPIYSMRITDDTAQPDDGSRKRIAVLIAGQHASEDVGNWMLRGALEFLCSADAKAVAARKNFEFLVYPHVNPMGRYGGHWRGDFNSANPTYDGNRRWVTTPGMECTTKNKAAITEDVAGRQIALWLDYHGGYSGYFLYSGSPLYAEYQTKMLVYNAGITIFGTNPTDSSTYYAVNTLGADLATPVESSRDQQLTEAQILAYGAASIKSLSDLFADGEWPAIVPPLLTNTSTLYAPTVIQALQPPLLTNTSVLYAPVVGENALYPPLLTNTSALFAPTVGTDTTLYPPLLSNVSVLYAPTVIHTLQPPLLTNTSVLYAPTVTGGVDTFTGPGRARVGPSTLRARHLRIGAPTL